MAGLILPRKPSLIAYSNRPPMDMSGGAVQVIANSDVTAWIGPIAIPDEVYEQLSPQERSRPIRVPVNRDEYEALLGKGELAGVLQAAHDEIEAGDGKPHEKEKKKIYLKEPVIQSNGEPIDIYVFPISKTMEKLHYTDISNNVLWPAKHQRPLFGSYSASELNDAFYDGYRPVDGYGSQALENLRLAYEQHGHDVITWVHDYQCTGVRGDMFSSHIPWPHPDYFSETLLDDGESLLETDFMQEMVRDIWRHPVVSFQTPRDLINFLDTTADIYELYGKRDEFLSQNNLDENTLDEWRDLVNDPERFSLNSPRPWGDGEFHAYGNSTRLLDVPVGVRPERTTLKGKVANGENLSATEAKDAAALGYEDKSGLIEQYMENLDNRRIVLSFHRNDYTKNTRAKLLAVEEYFEKHPKMVDAIRFVFVLEPTRAGVDGYDDYARDCAEIASRLKQNYPQSFMYMPKKESHDILMGLMRREEVAGVMGVATRDGHDLTVREAHDANDINGKRDMAVFVSSGIGASYVLRGTHQNGHYEPGAYIVDVDRVDLKADQETQDRQVAAAIVDALEDVYGNLPTLMTKRAPERRERFAVAQELSKDYTAGHYVNDILTQYEQARDIAADESRWEGCSLASIIAANDNSPHAADLHNAARHFQQSGKKL